MAMDNAKKKSSVRDRFPEMYKDWWYTISGCGGDLEEWKAEYQKMLDQEAVGTIREWVNFYGKDMNEYYNLTGTNRYPAHYTFLAFPTDGLDLVALAVIKMGRGDRWFTDIVDNNTRREEEKG